MDGWETRRRREPGHDWCIIRLGLPGVVRGVNVDTAFFRGNQPEACTVEAAELPPDTTAVALVGNAARWEEIVARTVLGPSAEHFVAVRSDKRWTHLRLNIFPDGGVARLRVFGEVTPDWERIGGAEVDLAAVEHGGRVLACSDMHFGSRHNLIMPGRAANMGDGWETRRRRGPGYDWSVIKLGRRGQVRKIEVDTNHFKGNFPESCMIEACDEPSIRGAGVPPAGSRDSCPTRGWWELLPRTKLAADKRHFFDLPAALASKPCTHVRLNIYPDGGVSRLRVHGVAAES
jgi:allantoicase